MYAVGCNIPETTHQDVDTEAEIMTDVFLRHRKKKYL